MSEVKAAILELVGRRDYVSFAELEDIPGFSGEGVYNAANKETGEDLPNTIFWHSISVEGHAAMQELQAEKRIFMHPASLLTYLADGKALRLPLAKSVRHYKEPHWAPVCWCKFPYKARKVKRA